MNMKLTFSFKTLQKAFERMFRKGRKLEYYRNPRRDWILILFTAILLSFGIIAFDTYLFLQISRGKIFTDKYVPTAPAQGFDRKRLNTVAEYYVKQEQNLEVLKTSKPPIVDPSR